MRNILPYIQQEGLKIVTADIKNFAPLANSRHEGLLLVNDQRASAELEYGAEYELNEEERRRIRNVSRMYSVTRLNEEMARRAGQLHARAGTEQGGDPGADAIDAMVAAVAETAGEKVITENVTDFQQLGVDVESF